jgi:hypothetical protein
MPTHTEKTLSCAREGVALWKWASETATTLAQLSKNEKLPIEVRMLLNGLATTGLHLQPNKCIFYEIDLTEGNRAKANERHRRWRANKSAKIAMPTYLPSSQDENKEAFQMWDMGGGTKETYEAKEAQILSAMNSYIKNASKDVNFDFMEQLVKSIGK